MVAGTGTNTLGFIVWTVVLTIVMWLATIVQQAFELKIKGIPHPFWVAVAKSANSGLYTCGAVIVLTMLALMVSCIVTIYREHNELTSRIAQLQQKLRERDQPSLSLRIKGWIVNQDQDHNAIVQLWLTLDNWGDPETLRGWELIVKTGDKVFAGRHTIGQEPLKYGLDIPFLDKEFQRPVGTVADMQGYVMFVVPGIDQAHFNNLHLDDSATLIVTAIDSKGTIVKAEKNVYETWKEGHRSMPAR
jgi:hypothetical protein